MQQGEDFLTTEQERTLATVLVAWEDHDKELFMEAASRLSEQIGENRLKRLIRANEAGQLVWIVEYWSEFLKSGDCHPNTFSSHAEAFVAAATDIENCEWANMFSLRATETFNA